MFSGFRGIYEPFNHNRKIIGFDTFEGHICAKMEHDGTGDLLSDGNLATTEGYEKFLTEIMDCHEQESPISHIRKFEVLKGDASQSIESYLERNPHTSSCYGLF